MLYRVYWYPPRIDFLAVIERDGAAKSGVDTYNEHEGECTMAKRVPKVAPVKTSKAKLQDQAPSLAWFDRQLDKIGKNRVGLSAEYDPSNKNWLQKILSGERRLQIAEAIWLAERFKLTLQDVLTDGLGFKVPTAPRRTVPVIGSVTADSRVHQYAPPAIEATEAPASARDEMAALRLETPHTALAVYAGCLLFYTPSPAMRVMPGSYERLSVIALGDMDAQLVGIPSRSSKLVAGRVTLLDGRTVVESEQFISAYPVEWTKST